MLAVLFETLALSSRHEHNPPQLNGYEILARSGNPTKLENRLRLG